MSRVKIQFPEHNPLCVVTIPVRIGDINYGNHLGNDAVLSIIHEARMQLLSRFGFTELDAGGTSLIMADVTIAYRNEAFYGDALDVSVYADEFTGTSFTLFYLIKTTRAGRAIDIAHARTGMVCFNYQTRKVAPVTDLLRSALIKSAD